MKHPGKPGFFVRSGRGHGLGDERLHLLPDGVSASNRSPARWFRKASAMKDRDPFLEPTNNTLCLVMGNASQW